MGLPGAGRPVYTPAMDNFVADAIFIDAAPARVFAALLDPQDVLVWMDAAEASIAPEPGGEFRVRRADGCAVTATVESSAPGRELVLADWFDERDGERRGPMRRTTTLEPRDDGIWLVVRHDDLDGQRGWEAFAQTTRRELVASTVALKRHIEGI